MTDASLIQLIVLPLGLGLLGFVEPCSIGSSLVFIKYLEGKNPGNKIAQVSVFTATRALFLAALGMLAAIVGTAFLGFQRGMWITFGTAYILIGALYALGRAGVFMRTVGPSLSRLSGTRGSVTLGLLFGLNIPACAAPLIFALLGTAAAESAGSASVGHGFVSLAIFGLALSLPLVVAVLVAPARRALDWLAGLSTRVPLWTGIVLVLLGLWSIGFGLFVSWEKWI